MLVHALFLVEKVASDKQRDTNQTFAIGEVKVSGSSETVVGVVKVMRNTMVAGTNLVLHTTDATVKGAFLLTGN